MNRYYRPLIPQTTKKVFINTLKLDEFVIIDEHPCKILEKVEGTYGKYSKKKIKILGQDIFSGEKYERLFPEGAIVDAPIVKYKKWAVNSLSIDGFLILMNRGGMIREDLRIPLNNIGNELRVILLRYGNAIVKIMKAMNKEVISDCEEIFQ
jgi:translation elongation factor P/translation initiation factor 5A